MVASGQDGGNERSKKKDFIGNYKGVGSSFLKPQSFNFAPLATAPVEGLGPYCRDLIVELLGTPQTF